MAALFVYPSRREEKTEENAHICAAPLLDTKLFVSLQKKMANSLVLIRILNSAPDYIEFNILTVKL